MCTRWFIMNAMGSTIADDLIAKGRKQERVRSRRQVLLNQLRRRFGELPRETVTAVEANKSVQELDTWLERFATAASLEKMGIGSQGRLRMTGPTPSILAGGDQS